MKESSLKKNTIFSYGNLIIKIVFGFITAPLIVMYIGRADYGLLNLILSITAYSNIMDFGLGNTVIRYTAQYNAEKKKEKEFEVVSFTLLFYICTACIFLVIGLGVYFNFENIFSITVDQISKAKVVFLLALVNAILNIPAMVFNAYIQGRNRYSFYNIWQISKTVIRLGLLIIFLNLGFGIVGIILVDLLLYQVVNIIYIYYCMHNFKLKLKFKRFNLELIKDIGQFSVFVFFGRIVNLIYWKTDNILLGMLDTTDNIAVYAVSQNLIAYINQFSQAFNMVLLPTLTMMAIKEKSTSKLRNFFGECTRIQVMIILPIVINFAFLGKDFIYLWMGKDFINAYYYTLVIIIPLSIHLMQTTGLNILLALKKHKMKTVFELITAIVNIFISILFINIFGPIGASLGTAVSITVSHIILLNIYYKKILKLKIVKYSSEASVKTIVCIIPTIIMLYFTKINEENLNFLVFIGRALMCNIPYVALLYIYSFKAKERDEIKLYVNKFTRKLKFLNTNYR